MGFEFNSSLKICHQKNEFISLGETEWIVWLLYLVARLGSFSLLIYVCPWQCLTCCGILSRKYSVEDWLLVSSICPR